MARFQTLQERLKICYKTEEGSKIKLIVGKFKQRAQSGNKPKFYKFNGAVLVENNRIIEKFSGRHTADILAISNKQLEEISSEPVSYDELYAAIERLLQTYQDYHLNLEEFSDEKNDWPKDTVQNPFLRKRLRGSFMLKKAWKLAKSGMFLEALEIFSIEENEFPSKEAYYGKAYCLHSFHKLKKSLSLRNLASIILDYESALTIDPEHSNSNFGISEALLTRSKILMEIRRQELDFSAIEKYLKKALTHAQLAHDYGDENIRADSKALISQIQVSQYELYQKKSYYIPSPSIN